MPSSVLSFLLTAKWGTLVLALARLQEKPLGAEKIKSESTDLVDKIFIKCLLWCNTLLGTGKKETDVPDALKKFRASLRRQEAHARSSSQCQVCNDVWAFPCVALERTESQAVSHQGGGHGALVPATYRLWPYPNSCRGLNLTEPQFLINTTGIIAVASQGCLSFMRDFRMWRI